MWIVYQKKDRKVVGLSAMSESDMERAAAIEEVVKGLVSGGAVNKYEAVQVMDRDRAVALLTAPIEHVTIEDDGKGNARASVQAPERFVLALQSDAPDVHPIDGMPEIKADGASFTTLTVTKMSERGEPRTSRTDNDELHVRSTAGSLQSADGKTTIRTVKLKQGQASLRLLSEPSRRVATVTVLCADPNIRDASLNVEFI
jgi:hypothetical protein